MRFTVPQFIEYETKIVGPLTFKQFIYIAIAGGICFALYFTVSFSLFILASIVLGSIASAFAFLQISGRPFSTVIGSFLKFNIGPKIYLWEKKEVPIMVLKKEEKMEIKKEEIPEEELPLKVAGNSQLKKIKTRIETKTK